MKRHLWIVALVGASLMAGVQAGAAVIDFQTLEHVDTNIANFGTTYSEDGFTFTQVPGGQPFPFATFGTLEGRYPGSTALFNRTVGSGTQLTVSGGGTFDIFSIDLANLNGAGSVSVTFLGTKPDLSTVTQTFTFNSFGVLSTFSFAPSFSGLATLDWSQDAPFHQFDNLVVVESVPEPTSLLLLGSGLLTLLVARRKHAA